MLIYIYSFGEIVVVMEKSCNWVFLLLIVLQMGTSLLLYASSKMKIGFFQVMKELQRLVCYSDFWSEHPGITTGGELGLIPK